MKTFNQLDKKDAPNIHKMLNREEDTFRSFLINKLIKSSREISPSEIALYGNDIGINHSPVTSGLQTKGLTALRDDGSLTGIYPFSAIATSHKVKLEDGTSVYAMCAIDSLGIAFELKQNVTITSSCSKCKIPITIQITDEVVSEIEPATTQALHVALGEYRNWASTC